MKKMNILVTGFAFIALAATIPNLSPTARAADDQGQPGEVGALAEVAAPNLRIVRTFMVTQDNLLALSTTAVNAFSPVAVACPTRAPNGCTVSVLVSSQLWDVDAGTTAQMNTTIAGAAGVVVPNSLVNVDPDTTGPLAATHTMQWMKTAVPAGSAETVTVAFKVSFGAAFAGYRTVTVVLYKN